MAKKSKSGPQATPNAPPLGIDGLRDSADDLGLSLDELSQAYASLLGTGDDPYAPAPDAADGLAEAGEEERVLQGLFAAEQQLRGASDGEPADDDSPEEEDKVTDGRVAAAAAPAQSRAGRAAVDRCEISPRTILEAMLFVGHPANEPLTAKHVASLMRGVLPREVDELVRELNDAYESEGAPYRIESAGAGYRLTLVRDFAGLRVKFLGRVREVRLTPAAVDVLAIIAYNQPIGRDEIDKLRSKSSGAVLNQLVRRGLLRVDLPDERGRKPIYYTTDRFLELFGLTTLDDLPRSQEIERSFS